MVRYDVFKQLESLTAMTKTNIGYSKFVQSGGDYTDYGVGFFEIVLHKFKTPSGEIGVSFLVATIDDGGYVARRYFDSDEKANALIEAIADNILKDMIIIPQTNELNVLLRPYGMYVEYNG